MTISKVSNRSIYFYLAIAFLFITCLIIADVLLSKHLSYMLPFISYGGTFKWAYLKIGNVKLSLYWSAYVVGIISMIAICVSRRKYSDLSKMKAVCTALLLAVFGFIGAKILFIVENITYVIENHVNVGMGGISFFGTVFFIPFVILVIARILKVNSLTYLDYCTPAGVVMLACIRCGCYMRGCCHGITVWVADKPFIFPVQLMECTLDLFLLDYLLKLERGHKHLHGRYVIFMGGYGMIRFLIEFIRDTPKDLLGLSNGQWFSLICIGIMGVYFLRRKFTQ